MNATGQTKTRRPIGVDLFAGVGGMSLGFEQAGFDVVAAVEYDPVHASVHKFNFPQTAVICADVARMETNTLLDAIKRGMENHGRDIDKWDQQIDVVFGGPPCQGFSTMGKRDVKDERNPLVYRFADIVTQLRPRYFVMENVPGMAAGAHGAILARLIARLERSGYEITSVNDARDRILNVKDFGVPQDRRRLILLGNRKDCRPLEYPHASVRPARKRANGFDVQTEMDLLPPGPTVWDAIGDLPDLDGFEELWDSDEVMLTLRQLALMNKKASPYVRKLRGLEEDLGDLSYPREWIPRLLTASLRTQHTSVSTRRFARTRIGETEEISRFYRLDPAGLCNTLRAGTGSERGAYTSPRPIHPFLPRVLSVREAARLHGFPDWFRFHRTKWHGFRSIGNAVPPALGRAVARQVISALDLQPAKAETLLSLGDASLLEVDRLRAAQQLGANDRHIPKTRRRLGAA